MENELKRRRQELGKELDDVARSTRIKASYLKAIEEEDFGKLPISVYTRGYIREYARFLGVAAEGTIVAYERHIERAQTPLEAEVNARGAQESRSKRAVNPPQNSHSRKLLLAATVLISIIGLYLALPRKESMPPVRQEVSQEPVAKVEREAPAEPVLTDASPFQASEPAPAKKHTIDITATDKVWLQVIIDGSERKESLLQAGERVNYEATDSLVLKIGNAGGVTLRYNNREIEPLGNKGQVIRLSFPESPLKNYPQGANQALSEKIVPSSEASHQQRPASVSP